MLDTVLGWMVVFAPFALSAIFILIPAKAEDRRAHMMWRWGILIFGLLFSAVAWWQQSRSAAENEKAIERTSKQVANDTTQSVTRAMAQQYRALIGSLTSQIGELKGQLAKQGEEVSAIGTSPFVSGRAPVPVKVTNPGDSQVPPAHEGHLTVSQRPDISTRKDAPYLTIVTVQSDVEFPALKLAVFCDHDLVAADGGSQGTEMVEWAGVFPRYPSAAGFSYQSAVPPFGPSNPVSLRIWSKEPVNCTKAETF